MFLDRSRAALVDALPRVGFGEMWRSTHVIAIAALVFGCRNDDPTPIFPATSAPSSGAVDPPVRASGPGTGRAETSSAETSKPSSGTASEGAGESESGTPTIRFDLRPPNDDLPACTVPPSEALDRIEFSYIWIANSVEGTVSKIDTETLEEVGRYLTRPDGAGDPSRTSVNLNGDVAVANRRGGITMIAARKEDCPDPDNTSTGADDVRPWPDGCVSWYQPFDYDSQRPVAWTHGVWNPERCRFEQQALWTSGHRLETTTADVLLLRETDGELEGMVTVDGVATDIYGLYGGAVDAHGDFWATGLGLSSLYHVRLEDFAVETFRNPVPAYGITVDHAGRVWTCEASVSRFDPRTWEFAFRSVDGEVGHWGCMEDAQGTLWVSGRTIVGIDTDSLEVVATLEVPAPVRGISLDALGRVWGPSFDANAAYRVDPRTAEVATVRGLVGPYTYSDMTGFALRNVLTPEG